jgi:hypothetical protein
MALWEVRVSVFHEPAQDLYFDFERVSRGGTVKLDLLDQGGHRLDLLLEQVKALLDHFLFHFPSHPFPIASVRT